MLKANQILVIALSIFFTTTASYRAYGEGGNPIAPTDAVVKELFNRALNNAYNLHDGVIYTFTGEEDVVSDYFKFRVLSTTTSGCQPYKNNVVSCVVSYQVESAANDPITKRLVASANSRPVRREFQRRGNRWYLLPQR